MKFVKVRVRNYLISHGYDSQNVEIQEKIEQPDWVEKLISIDRILSVSEKYILTTYGFNRLLYWEYEGGLQNIESFLMPLNAEIKENRLL